LLRQLSGFESKHLSKIKQIKKLLTLHRGASSNFLDSLAGRREGREPECLLVKKRNSWSTDSAVLLDNLVLNHQVRVKKEELVSSKNRQKNKPKFENLTHKGSQKTL
jgi:hypothetical protein